jgi:tetratricopeptide (TPR) repeat protein
MMTQLRYAEAANYFAEAVDLLPEGSNAVRADYLNRQGEAAWHGGDYRMAVQSLRRALAIREGILPPEHPDVAQSLNNLALLYYNTGRTAEAEPLLQRSIAILEKTLPPEHPHRMQVRGNYAVLLDQLGRPAEAAELRAQVIREQRGEPSH